MERVPGCIPKIPKTDGFTVTFPTWVACGYTSSILYISDDITPTLSTSPPIASSTGGGATRFSSFLDELGYGAGALDDRFGSLTEFE